MNELLQVIIQREVNRQIIAHKVKRILGDHDLSLSSGAHVRRVKADCDRVMRELLAGEFSEVKERVFIVLCKGDEDDFIAQINRSIKGCCIILVHLKSWATDPAFSERHTGLRDLIRHELLHAEIKRGDKDPLFQAELKRRGIGYKLRRHEYA